MAQSPLRRAAPALGSTALVAFLAALVLVGLGGWEIVRTRQAMLDDAEKNTITLARALAEHAGRTIDAVDVTVRDAVSRVESGGDPQRLRASLLGLGARNPMTNLAAVDAAGQWIADTIPPHAPASSVVPGSFAWHRDHDDQGPYLGDRVVGKKSGEGTISLSRRVANADGSFGGVVVATLDPASFRCFDQTVQMEPHGTVALWHDDGHRLVHCPELQNSDEAPASFASATQPPRTRSGVARIRSPPATGPS